MNKKVVDNLGKILVFISIIFFISVVIYGIHIRTVNEIKYIEGVALLKEGEYDEALVYLKDIIDFKDVKELLEEHGFKVCPNCHELLEE